MKSKKSIRFLKHHTNTVYGNVYIGKVVHDVKEDDATALVKAGLAEFCESDDKSISPEESPANPEDETDENANDDDEGDGNDNADDIKATDAAKELADEKGIDLAEVTGTGKNGSITKGDVEKFLEDKAE